MGALPGGVGQEAPQGLEALEAAGIVVKGTVERLVHGLYADGEPATLVEFRVTSILKGSASVHVGDRITVMESFGTTTTRGASICVDKPDYRLPKEHEEVVVGGERDPINQGHLLSDESLVYLVEKGMVTDGAPRQTDWRPITLDDLTHLLVGRS
jgi:hypothetical protein